MDLQRFTSSRAVVLLSCIAIAMAQETNVRHCWGAPPIQAEDVENKTTENKETDKPDAAEQQEEKAAAEKPQTEADRINAELDRVEAEIAAAERFGAYGDEAVFQVAQGLRDEFLDNQSMIESYDAQSDADEIKRLKTRQTLIKVYIWQLKNVGSQISRAKRGDGSNIRGMHEVLRKFPGMMQDVKFRDRFNELNQREHKLLALKMGGYGPAPFQLRDPIDDPVVSNQGEMQGVNPIVPFNRVPNKDPFIIERLKEPIGMLIKLDWNEDSVVWDREHWESPFAGKSLADIQNEVNEMLKKQGIEIPEPSPGFQVNARAQPPSLLLFENLQSHAGVNASGFSMSGSQGGFEKQFTNAHVSASFRSMAQSYDLQIQETQSPARLLRIQSKTEHDLKLRLIDDESILVIDQRPTGQIKLVHILDDQTFSVSGASFSELYREHRTKIEEEIFPRLVAMGILISPVDFD